MKKKQLFLIALIVLLVSSIGYGTYAYTTVEGTATSVITTSGVSIDLVEMRDDGKPFPGKVHGVYPGAEESKIVFVENDGPQTAWVRVAVDVKIDLDPAYDDGSTPDVGLVHPNFNKKDWTYKDGYFYYNKPLKPGSRTEDLFTKVTFDTAMGNLYQNSTAYVNVSAQATQYKNNEHGDNVLAVPIQAWPGNNQ